VAELGAVTRALLAIARGKEDDAALASRICAACVGGLDVDGAAISVLTTTDARQTLAATDVTAELLEELQFSFNEGACIEAATTGAPVLVPDLDDRVDTAGWPLFAAAVRARTDVRALFALPLQWGAIRLGVLDLYRATVGGLSEHQLWDAISAADAAALMLLGQRTDPAGDGGWLDLAVGHRAEIHQATGMVMVQLGVDAADALARLRGHAFTHGLLLVDVARAVVGRQLVFASEME
jgi:ANTAR domain/GAF domain